MTKTAKKHDIHRSERRTARLFIALPVIGFCVFTLLTLVAVIGFSLLDYNIYRNDYTWKGLGNFIELFTNKVYSKEFIRSIVNTFVLLIGVPIGIIAGVAVAALLQSKALKKGSKFFQIMYYLPAVTSAVAVNLVFRYIFNPEYGMINSLFKASIPWYSNDWLIKVAIIIKNTWGGMGGTMILSLAAMLAIPTSYYEAADIDGASATRKFFKITLPLITPTLFYMLITGIIGGLQSYADAQIFASGANGARTIVFFIWNYGIHTGRQGVASAASLLLAVVIMLITLVQFRLSNKWVYEA